MRKSVTTGSVWIELGVRLGMIVFAVGLAGSAMPTESGGGPLGVHRLRSALFEMALGYAGRVHDAISMILVLPIF